MNFFFYFLVGIVTSFVTSSKIDHHGSHRSKRAENGTGKLGFLNGHAADMEEAGGRGFFDHMKNFFKKFQPGDAGPTTMAPIKGPIEESDIYETAMEGKFFAQQMKIFSTCKKAQLHPTQQMVVAAIKCKNEKNFACFMTCAWNEIGVTKAERLDEQGMTAHVDRFLKKQSETVRKLVKSTFNSCFEDGTRLLLAGSNCIKNKKVVKCITQDFKKHCEGEKEDSEEKKDEAKKEKKSKTKDESKEGGNDKSSEEF